MLKLHCMDVIGRKQSRCPVARINPRTPQPKLPVVCSYLIRGSIGRALERNRKHLAPNVPKNLPSKIMAAAERKGTYAERNGT